MPLHAQLGNLSFRINPSQVTWDYHLDTSVTQTIGGRVVQVYGATLGDMTVQGLFGQEHSGANRQSRQMAEEFATEVSKMVMAQSKAPTKAQLTGASDEAMHKPFRFVCSGDGLHNWDFQVYIKSLTDVNDSSITIEHKVGKFSYGYNLVLFIVEDNTGKLKEVATDAFIDRLTKGIGWQRTSYNGGMTPADLEAYLAANSPDGTIHGLVLKQFQEVSQGQLAGGTGFTPGAGATGNEAVGEGVGGQVDGTQPNPNAPPATPPPATPPPGTPAPPRGSGIFIPNPRGGPPIEIPIGGVT